MKQNQFTLSMIRTAIADAILAIGQDPLRGLRNLVDLDEMFATGMHHKQFIKTAQKVLRQPKSAYYKLVRDTIKSVDRRVLVNFCINMGYHGLSVGASKIRDLEQQQGYNIPWCLMLDLNRADAMSAAAVSDLMDQGKALGIHFYLIRLNECYPHQDELLDELSKHKNCCVQLFLSPELVNEHFIERVLKAGNIMLTIDMEPHELLSDACDMLRQKRLLFAGYRHLGDDLDQMTDASIYRQCEQMQVPFLIWVRNEMHLPSQSDGAYQALCDLRKTLEIPVLPIDIIGDIAYIDRNISTEACLAYVSADGHMKTTNLDDDAQASTYQIQNTPLSEIFSYTMPKHN